MGTMYLMVPKLRTGGYVPFFITERKRSENALIHVIQEAFVLGVSTRRMEKLAKSLGIESISKSCVSEMTKGLNDQVSSFRTRDLSGTTYPILWTDALYEKVRVDGRVISMAVLIVCGVNKEGQREILALEPMMEESKESYSQLFRNLKKRGLTGPVLIVSDAHSGLKSSIAEEFPGASWQRCKVHFMRNILVNVPHHAKEAFASELKEIWTAPREEDARRRAERLTEKYEGRFPKAVRILEEGLDDSLAFYGLEDVDPRKISSTNMLERLNKEIRRRTRPIGIFPNADSYIRLVTIYLIEYSEDWSANRAYLSQDSLQKLPSRAA
jgi:transposase-like protein